MEYSPIRIEEEILILREVDDSFEELYLKVRASEGRLLSDQEVRMLPDLPSSHRHHREWQLRKKTLIRFLAYLKGKTDIKRILDVGCGNGWFTHYLSKALPNAEVLGLDINLPELKQGRRVFTSTNLQFGYGNILNIGSALDGSFDMIVLNASAQYFPSFEQLHQRLIKCLRRDAEIHILDSPFYSQTNLSAASNRSERYYSTLGIPEMANHYYHHSMEALHAYELMFKPKSSWIKQFMGRADSPFGWWRYPW